MEDNFNSFANKVETKNFLTALNCFDIFNLYFSLFAFFVFFNVTPVLNEGV